jgi:hypothetical protein
VQDSGPTNSILEVKVRPEKTCLLRAGNDCGIDFLQLGGSVLRLLIVAGQGAGSGKAHDRQGTEIDAASSGERRVFA